MDFIKVLIGLVCLLPKASLSFFFPFDIEAHFTQKEYWTERCRVTVGELFGDIATVAKARAQKCKQRIESEELEDDFNDTLGEKCCRMDRLLNQCVSKFFEDVTLCLNEGEPKKMTEFFLKLNAEDHEFLCNGTNGTWYDAFSDADNVTCIDLKESELNECLSREWQQQLNARWTAHARGESYDSFEELFCLHITEDNMCITEILHLCGNRRAVLLHQNYTDHVKGFKQCQLLQTSGSARLRINHLFVTLLTLLILTK